MAGVTVLQLDTKFPRIAGDIASPETYNCALEVVRVPSATVASIVTDKPDGIDITPFIDAARNANGDLVTTSCGFLAPFQKRIAQEIDRPFVASALIDLERLSRIYGADIQVLTFDAEKLSTDHSAALPDCIGLIADMHLRQVIEGDLDTLDKDRARAEILRHLRDQLKETTRALLLECTNLPPYKAAICREFNIPIFDILTVIEQHLPKAIKSAFLKGIP